MSMFSWIGRVDLSRNGNGGATDLFSAGFPNRTKM